MRSAAFSLLSGGSFGRKLHSGFDRLERFIRTTQELVPGRYLEGTWLMACPIRMRPRISFGTPKRLFPMKSVTYGSVSRLRRFDVSPDGEKFVIAEPLEVDSPAVIRVVQNWFAEFRDRERD